MGQCISSRKTQTYRREWLSDNEDFAFLTEYYVGDQEVASLLGPQNDPSNQSSYNVTRASLHPPAGSGAPRRMNDNNRQALHTYLSSLVDPL